MRKRMPPATADPGLALIDNWEAHRLAGTLQKMKDDGLDEATIARERPAMVALIVAAAEQLRIEHRANQSRSPQP
jgi:hypothetical protein